MIQRLNILLVSSGIGLAVGTAAPAEDWSQLQRDPEHSGRSPVSVVPGYQAKWVWVDEAHVTHDFVSKKGASISYPNPRTVILAGDAQPIVVEDKIFFGACSGEFYALDAQTGRELWRKKLGGQSFMYSWPVVHQGLVMTFVMVPDGLSEFKMEKELDALSPREKNESRADYAARIWPQERAAIRRWLAENPIYRNFYVMRTRDGSSPFKEEVPMGRVGGIGYPGRAPVIDQADRILLYWRTRSSVFLTGGTFGTKHTPDLGAMDPATGDRVWFNVSSPMGSEIDNNFTLTVGGDYVYLNNHMRGAHGLNLKNGSTVRATSILADWDGANFRNWGNRLIWIGNDANPQALPPPSIHRSPQGDCGVVLATIKGRPMMFIQESGHYQIDFGCLAAVEGKP